MVPPVVEFNLELLAPTGMSSRLATNNGQDAPIAEGASSFADLLAKQVNKSSKNPILRDFVPTINLDDDSTDDGGNDRVNVHMTRVEGRGGNGLREGREHGKRNRHPNDENVTFIGRSSAEIRGRSPSYKRPLDTNKVLGDDFLDEDDDDVQEIDPPKPFHIAENDIHRESDMRGRYAMGQGLGAGRNGTFPAAFAEGGSARTAGIGPIKIDSEVPNIPEARQPPRSKISKGNCEENGTSCGRGGGENQSSDANDNSEDNDGREPDDSGEEVSMEDQDPDFEPPTDNENSSESDDVQESREEIWSAAHMKKQRLAASKDPADVAWTPKETSTAPNGGGHADDPNVASTDGWRSQRWQPFPGNLATGSATASAPAEAPWPNMWSQESQHHRADTRSKDVSHDGGKSSRLNPPAMSVGDKSPPKEDPDPLYGKQYCRRNRPSISRDWYEAEPEPFPNPPNKEGKVEGTTSMNQSQLRTSAPASSAPASSAPASSAPASTESGRNVLKPMPVSSSSPAPKVRIPDGGSLHSGEDEEKSPKDINPQVRTHMEGRANLSGASHVMWQPQTLASTRATRAKEYPKLVAKRATAAVSPPSIATTRGSETPVSDTPRAYAIPPQQTGSSNSAHAREKEQGDLRGARERLKDSDEFRQADEEEWARRQEELQRQAAEVQKQKKRKKAEAERKAEMELRQRQRLEEVRRENQRQEAAHGQKNEIRGKIQARLERGVKNCSDLASVLTKLGIDVGGGPQPTLANVQAAYKKALLKFHPDRAAALAQGNYAKQVEAEESFKLVSRLKTTLPLTKYQPQPSMYRH